MAWLKARDEPGLEPDFWRAVFWGFAAFFDGFGFFVVLALDFGTVLAGTNGQLRRDCTSGQAGDWTAGLRQVTPGLLISQLFQAIWGLNRCGTKRAMEKGMGEDSNNKWLLPAAVFGLGGLGLLALSDRGIDALGWLVGRVKEAPSKFLEWNDAAQKELDRIESALERMAEAMEVAQ